MSLDHELSRVDDRVAAVPDPSAAPAHGAELDLAGIVRQLRSAGCHEE